MLLLLAVGSALLAQTASGLTLAWNPGPTPNVAGYNLYYGTSSHNYTGIIPVGLGASAVVPGLVEGMTYFFSVTAVNSLGLESAFSNEINYTVKSTKPALKLLLSPTKQVTVPVTGELGRAYEIQSSPDLRNWSLAGIVVLGLSVNLDFTDTSAAGKPTRFYRVRPIL